jgi:hypothetical protein
LRERGQDLSVQQSAYRVAYRRVFGPGVREARRTCTNVSQRVFDRVDALQMSLDEREPR